MGWILQTINNPESSRCAVSYTFKNGRKFKTVMDAPGSENANSILNSHYQNYNTIFPNYDPKTKTNNLQNIMHFNDPDHNGKTPEQLIIDLITHSEPGESGESGEKKALKQGFVKGIDESIKTYNAMMGAPEEPAESEEVKKNNRTLKRSLENLNPINCIITIDNKDNTDKLAKTCQCAIPGFNYPELIGQRPTELEKRRNNDLFPDVYRYGEKDNNITGSPSELNDKWDPWKTYSYLRTGSKAIGVNRSSSPNKDLYYAYMKTIVRQSLYILPLISEMKRKAYKTMSLADRGTQCETFSQKSTAGIVNPESHELNFITDGGGKTMENVKVPEVLYFIDKSEQISQFKTNSHDTFVQSINPRTPMTIESNHDVIFPIKSDQLEYLPIIIMPIVRESEAAADNTKDGIRLLINQIIGVYKPPNKGGSLIQTDDTLQKGGNLDINFLNLTDGFNGSYIYENIPYIIYGITTHLNNPENPLFPEADKESIMHKLQNNYIIADNYLLGQFACLHPKSNEKNSISKMCSIYDDDENYNLPIQIEPSKIFISKINHVNLNILALANNYLAYDARVLVFFKDRGVYDDKSKLTAKVSDIKDFTKGSIALPFKVIGSLTGMRQLFLGKLTYDPDKPIPEKTKIYIKKLIIDYNNVLDPNNIITEKIVNETVKYIRSVLFWSKDRATSRLCIPKILTLGTSGGCFRSTLGYLIRAYADMVSKRSGKARERTYKIKGGGMEAGETRTCRARGTETRAKKPN